MTQNVKELINGHLDGVLTDDQQAELAAWIEADPTHADQFAEAVFFDNRLHAEVNAARYKDNRSGGILPTLNRTLRAAKGSRRYGLRIAAVAVCLLVTVGVGAWFSQDDRQHQVTNGLETPDESAFASITQIIGAQWDDGHVLSIGDRLTAQTIQLRSGFLQLAFDDGVEVTLQGPAEYELLAAGKTKLTSGLLTATVPPGAEGFTVDTSTVKVIDLGTSFGIDLREDGFSSVSVFDGEVEIALRDASQKRLLTEGDSVRIGDDQQIEKVEFDAQRFAKLWPVFSGIVGSTEAFRFVPPWPKKIRMVNSDKDIFVATEGYAVDLINELQVNISEPGSYTLVDDLTPLGLPANERVRSYILHYSPTTQVGVRRARRVSGSITFDRPVLGLIVGHEELLASSRRFTRRSAGEAQYRRQLSFTGGADGDRITLSEDRKTVTLDLISPQRSSDLVRVIVDGKAGFKPSRKWKR